MLGMLDARPLLGRPAETDRFEFAQKNPSRNATPASEVDKFSCERSQMTPCPRTAT